MRIKDVAPDDIAAAAAYYQAGRSEGTWTPDKSEELLRTMNNPQALLAEMERVDQELQGTDDDRRQRACAAISATIRRAREMVDALRTLLGDDDRDAEADDHIAVVGQLLQRADQVALDAQSLLVKHSGDGAKGEDQPAPSIDTTEIARRAIESRSKRSPS